MEHNHAGSSVETVLQNLHPMAIGKVHPETDANDENTPVHDQKTNVDSSPRSSSSSSSSASSDPLDEKDLIDGSRSPFPDVQYSPDDPTNMPQWSMMSVSPRAGMGTPNVSGPLSDTKVYPTVQVMGRPPGYDPSRIPSSVFSSKPAASTMEWSVASNESLFSIHMGNNSFSKDYMFKSGELNRPEEWMSSPYSVSEANTPSGGLPTVIEVAEHDTKNASSPEEEHGDGGEAVGAVNHTLSKKDSVTEKVPSPKPEANLDAGASEAKGVVQLNPPDGPRNSSSTPRLSNESGNSVSSFAFPVLGSEGSMKADNEKSWLPPMTEPVPEAAEAKDKPETPIATPRVDENKSLFRCFACFPICR